MSTPNEEKTYVLVRSDIPHGYQIVQSAHAAAEHYRLHPGTPHGTMIVLAVPDEETLLAYFNRIRVLAPTTIFFEPDIDAYTALAVSPSDFYNLFRYLPLAG